VSRDWVLFCLTACNIACAGKLRLFVSNNDRQVRIFDMPSMRRVDAICCPAPVNYASLSPDGALLACVGDSDETLLYRACPSGRPLQAINLTVKLSVNVAQQATWSMLSSLGLDSNFASSV